MAGASFMPRNSIAAPESPCPFCGCKATSPLFTVRDHVFKTTDRVFQVYYCTQCRAAHVSPRPSAEELVKFYPPAFYWSWESAGSPLSWEQTIARRSRQLAEKFRWIEDMPPGRLLDVGAQKGEFLWYARQFGWQVEGVELDNAVPNPAALPIHYGDFLQLHFAETSFDCVTFWAVLEHLPDPAQFIAKAARLLKPGGRLVALVTNFNSIQARLYRADDYPRHLNLFSARAIRMLCERHGLQIRHLRTDQRIFGGALNGGILCLFKMMGGYSFEEVLQEWKQLDDPMLYWAKWRGRPSLLVRNVSRLDRLLSVPVEWLLDRLGFGFIMTFKAEKVSEDERALA